jgi:DNA polymerase I-like protein with 3'-5' exonuclease and polymerase domains
MGGGYSILRKARSCPPSDLQILSELPNNLKDFEGQPVVFDLETHGTNPKTGTVRSVAIANDAGTLAVDLEALTWNDRRTFTSWLLEQPLVAHNMVFDGAWLYEKTDKMPQMEACTLVLFKLLATEGYLGQRWGLKQAMVDVLGWEESNEADLYGWLKDNKLKAKDMAQAPWDILGKYNALDAAGTWQLYKALRATIEEHGWENNVLEFHRKDFVNLIKLLIEQQISGMSIDIQALEKFDTQLSEKIEEKRQEFLADPEVKPHVEYYQEVIIEELKKLEPPKLTKKGEITARYQKWEEKVAEAHNRIDFNIDSTQQLQWLFYERLFYECPIKTEKGVTSVGKKALPHLGALGKLLKEYRELRDRRKFVTALKNVHQNGVLYPTIKPHGTLTGRSSGGEFGQ